MKTLCISDLRKLWTISSCMWVRSELNSWECLQLKSFITRDFMFLMTCTIATVFFSSITCKNSLFLEWVILRLLFLELISNLWLKLCKAKARLRNEPCWLFDLSEHEGQGVTDREALVSKLTFGASWWGLAQINEGAVGLNPELPGNVHELESQEPSTVYWTFHLGLWQSELLSLFIFSYVKGRYYFLTSEGCSGLKWDTVGKTPIGWLGRASFGPTVIPNE